MRPVHLVPAGPGAHRGPRDDVARALQRARRATAGPTSSWTACSSGAARGAIRPSLDVRLRAPGGRVTERTFQLPPQRAERRHMQLSMPVPAPVLWSPDSPQLYGAVFTLRNGDRVVQRERRSIGLRSVEVKRGPPVAQQPPHPAPRRLDPRGHAGLGRGAYRRRHGPDRRGPEGPRRQHHARPLPAEPAAARPARPRRDHGLEPGADLAARLGARREPARAAEGARAGAPDGAADGHRGAQPPRGAHALGRERADLHARPASRPPSASCSPRGRRRTRSTRRSRSPSTSRAAPASRSSSPTTRST